MANTALGYGFTAVFVSYIANTMLMWVHSLVSPLFIVALFYSYQQLQMIESSKISNAGLAPVATTESYDSQTNPCNCDQIKYRLKNCDFAFSFWYYGVNSIGLAAFLWMLSSILMCIQGMTIISQTVPVIMLYQLLGVEALWLILWLFWCLTPSLVCVIYSMVVTTYMPQFCVFCVCVCVCVCVCLFYFFCNFCFCLGNNRLHFQIRFPRKQRKSKKITILPALCFNSAMQSFYQCIHTVTFHFQELKCLFRKFAIVCVEKTLAYQKKNQHVLP